MESLGKVVDDSGGKVVFCRLLSVLTVDSIDDEKNDFLGDILLWLLDGVGILVLRLNVKLKGVTAAVVAAVLLLLEIFADELMELDGLEIIV